MADDTTQALQALIKKVSTLTETVQTQQQTIEGIKKHNERLLDQVKDDKRAEQHPSGHPQETIADIAKIGMVPGDDGNWYMKGHAPNHTISRADARDRQKYLNAKQKADAAGATLRVVDDVPSEDSHRRGRGDIARTKTMTIKDEDAQVAYMRRDAMTDTAAYQRLRKAGFLVHQWAQPEDLPEHMQTKLALMEKANDAV